jgi:uncharacterized protein YndB with AHSA1/START domain
MAKLKIELPENSQNILGTTIINAPLEKVFGAYVDKEMFSKWIGGDIAAKVNVDIFDAKSGGCWHMVNTDKEGNSWPFGGSYHEVANNERIIWTFEFLGMPERGHVVLERMDFVRVDENTTEIRTISTYQSVSERDNMVESGMEDGWRSSIETLEKVLQ